MPIPYPSDREPLHSTLWTRQADYDKPIGLLRVVRGDRLRDPYPVQRLEPTLHHVAEIPSMYVVDNGRLLPAPPSR